MSSSLRLALEGFSAFERQALQSYFRLCMRRPGFEAGASLADCDFCVVDADRPAAVEAVRAARRQGASLYVGAAAPDGAAAHLPRPIDPRRVASALDALAREAPSSTMSSGATELSTAAAAELPAAPACSTPAAPASAPSPSRKAGTASFNLDVLVVDDIDTTRRLLVMQLESLGCRVAEAVNAQQALARLAEQRYRLVFADVALAELDGLVLCQRIKQGGAGAPAVVLVGAAASASDRVRGLLSGCDEHLAKPIASEALFAVLNAHGNRRRRARQD
ncbi:MAG: response regulator [Methylibium sp.]|nr:response regulator [Methylibium sp.]